MAFQDRKIFQHPKVQEAAGLVSPSRQDAIEVADLLAEENETRGPDLFIAHMLFHGWDKTETVENISARFSDRTGEIIQGIRDVMRDPAFTGPGRHRPYLSQDEDVRLSFLALAVFDLEYGVEKYGDAKASDHLFSFASTKKGMQITQTTVGDQVQKLIDMHQDSAGPLIGTTPAPLLEKRFTDALGKLKAKIEPQPETEAVVSAAPATPRKPSP